MSATTGPVLAMGAITVFNQNILNDKPFDMRVPVATGFAAVGFALFERINGKLASGVVWIAMLTVLLARVDPKVPSPVETLLKMWEKK